MSLFENPNGTVSLIERSHNFDYFISLTNDHLNVYVAVERPFSLSFKRDFWVQEYLERMY